MNCPTLYSGKPFETESGTEASDESGLATLVPKRDVTTSSTSKKLDEQLPELSGRSRAILKTYFGETKPFDPPQGHPTVAFTEPQMYLLLRVMSDETLRMSYSTMEKIVIDAVKGKLTTAPSWTAYFQARRRAQTPLQWEQGDQSSSDTDHDTNPESRAVISVSSRDSSFDGKSDSATEMALISASLGEAPQTSHPTRGGTASTSLTQPIGEDEYTDHSSHDTGEQEQAEEVMPKVPLARSVRISLKGLVGEESQWCPKNISPRLDAHVHSSQGLPTLSTTHIWPGAICVRKTFPSVQRAHRNFTSPSYWETPKKRTTVEVRAPQEHRPS